MVRSLFAFAWQLAATALWCGIVGAAMSSADEFATTVAEVTVTAADAASDADQQRSVPALPSDEVARWTAIRQALDAPATLDCDETPLSEVATLLSNMAGVPVIIDQRSLDQQGMGPDTPVTFVANQIALRSLLRHMLGDLELTYIVRNQMIVITTRDEADSCMSARVYTVADLADNSPAPLLFDEPRDHFRLAQEVIQSHVAPDSWDELGGAATIASFQPWNVLSITQTDDGHERVEALLSAIRQARGGTGEADTAAIAALGANARDASQRIHAALDSNVTLDFDGAPLAEVLASLQSKHAIPIRIHHSGLEDIGLGQDTPVTGTLTNVSLRSALSALLQQLELVFVVRDEILVVTTPWHAQQQLMTVVYPVADFLEGSGASVESDRAEQFADALVKLVTNTVAPDSWDFVGGAGVITVARPWGLLFVSQVDEVHREIEALLAAARGARQKTDSTAATPPPVSPWTAPRAKVAVPDGQRHMLLPGVTAPGFGAPGMTMNPFEGAAGAGRELTLKIHRLPAGIPSDQLVQAIQAMIEPGSWAFPAGASAGLPGGSLGPTGSIHVVGRNLLVRHRQPVHAQINELLETLASREQQSGGVGGMGGFGGAGMGGMGGGGMGGMGGTGAGGFFAIPAPDGLGR